MRTIKTDEIIENVKEMCIEANHYLTPDMEEALKAAAQSEKAPLGKQILGQLKENLEIAAEEMIPICQDTGMAVLFVEIGQEVHIEGGSLTEALQEAGPTSRITLNFSSSYSVFEGISPAAILQKIQLSSFFILYFLPSANALCQNTY